jgi:hypothetical protein
MVKSHRSKRHHKKHRGGEGEATDNNSVLNMDEAPSASAPAAASASAPADAARPAVTSTPATATPVTATPAEEEKKGLMDTVKGWFGGSKTKRVRFRMTRKTKRSAKRSGSKRSGSKRSAKRSSAKRSGSKRSSAKRKSRSKSSSRK